MFQHGCFANLPCAGNKDNLEKVIELQEFSLKLPCDILSADILRENNSLVLTFSKNDILNYLYLIIYENYKFKMNDKTRKNYDALQVAKKFDSFISEVKNESK